MAPIRSAAVCLAAVGAWNLLSQAFVAPRPSMSPRTGHVAMRAASNTAGGGFARGPLVVYMDALIDAANNAGESVAVTKDVMRYKRLREKMTADMQFELATALNQPGTSELEQASATVEIMGPWESTVFPKFVTFLAKKRRFKSLRAICEEYVSFLYARESIEPVTVFSAAKLTDEQVDKIKAKMADKLGVRDIKLIQQVDPSLLSGFKIEWRYTDPENPLIGAESIDLSLQSALEQAAISGR
ncbi:unnamed protein product [Prorocentrum cordatum]|uniref:Uncharacterized protein n=1 Tax=Prorocentrum cordatum TaxID=2364126 RepID=A0ABN9Q9R3_9DINO|nr:unnamed protein product [Polarella glacialis]